MKSGAEHMTGHPDEEAEDDLEEAPEDDHLSDVADGSGCTEIWEHLSERRDAEDDEE